MTRLYISGSDGGDFSTGAIAWDVLKGVAACNRGPCEEIDLSAVQHLKPYSIACLAALGCASSRLTRVIPPRNVECINHLHRLGFFRFFSNPPVSDAVHRETNVPVEQRPDRLPGSFATEAMEAWQQTFGNLSPGVGPDLATHLDEVIRNAVSHAESAIGCVVCGQAFPKRRRLDVAVVDLGQTIRGHLTKNPLYRHIETDFEAILEATKDAVTGTPRGQHNRLNEPNSGAGLYMLRNYCEQGGGEMTILSGSSYVVFGEGFAPENAMLRQPFPGCLVNIRFFIDFDLPESTADTIIW